MLNFSFFRDVENTKALEVCKLISCTLLLQWLIGKAQGSCSHDPKSTASRSKYFMALKPHHP